MIELAATLCRHAADADASERFVQAVLAHYMAHTLLNAAPLDGVSAALEQLSLSGRTMVKMVRSPQVATLQ